MATSTSIYANFRKLLLDAGATGGGFDFDTNTIKMLLVSSSYSPNYDTHDFLDDITNELSGNGYARQTLGTTAITKVGSGASAKYKATSAAASFTASGGPIVARGAVLFKDTGDASTSPLICYILLDTTPADVSVPDTGTLTITPDGTNGWFYT